MEKRLKEMIELSEQIKKEMENYLSLLRIKTLENIKYYNEIRKR